MPEAGFSWKVGGALGAGILVVAVLLWGVFRDTEPPQSTDDSRSALTTTADATSVTPRDVTTTIPVTTTMPIERQVDTTRLVASVRSLLGRDDLPGAAKAAANGLSRAPQDPALTAASGEVLDAAATRADGFRQAANRAGASNRAEYVEGVTRLGSATRLRQAGRVEQAVGEYLAAVRLFGQAATATIAATTSVPSTTSTPVRPPASVTTTAPVRPPATTTSVVVAAPSIDPATVEQLLRRYASASRSFDAAGVQQLYPRLPNATKLRMDALRKNFAFCDYSFTNIQIVSGTASEAVVRADSVESCKPKTAQKAFDTPSRQEFRLSRSQSGPWIISEVFISQ